MFHWFSNHGVSKGVIFIQETHTSEDSYREWKCIFKGEIIMSHGTNNSKGVAILLGNKLEHKIKSEIIDKKGRYIILLIEIQGTEFILINIYQPNDEPGQIETLGDIVSKVNGLEAPVCIPIIWGGDFNVTFTHSLEAVGGNPVLKVRTLESLQLIMTDMDLCDIWRLRNPNSKQFTWSGLSRAVKGYKYKN
jgi:exonuclease III